MTSKEADPEHFLGRRKAPYIVKLSPMTGQANQTFVAFARAWPHGGDSW